MTLPLTLHAHRRTHQRAISEEAIEAVIDYGIEYRQPHRTVFFLGKRQVEEALRLGVEVRDFENTAIVVADDGAILTVIRTSDTSKFRSTRDASLVGVKSTAR
jgi:hypothetical protein